MLRFRFIKNKISPGKSLINVRPWFVDNRDGLKYLFSFYLCNGGLSGVFMCRKMLPRKESIIIPWLKFV